MGSAGALSSYAGGKGIADIVAVLSGAIATDAAGGIWTITTTTGDCVDAGCWGVAAA